MGNDFLLDLRTFICARTGGDAPLPEQSPEFLKRCKASNELHDQLKTILTEEQKKLFTEFDEAKTAVETLAEDNAYLKGLRDGMKLAEILESGF